VLVAAGTASLTLLAPAVADASKAAHLPLGYYQCYGTNKDVSQINGEVSYSTVFEASFTLKAKNRYVVSFLYSGGAGPGNLIIKGHSVRFGGGAWDSNANFEHLRGTVYPHGATMPNSQLDPSKRYKLVLRGGPHDTDTAPPTSEFTGAVPRSFWYCNKR
jgi:hypothetical protein